MEQYLNLYFPNKSPIVICNGFMNQNEYENTKSADIRLIVADIIKNDLVFYGQNIDSVLVVIKNSCGDIIHSYIANNCKKYSFKNIKLQVEFYNIFNQNLINFD